MPYKQVLCCHILQRLDLGDQPKNALNNATHTPLLRGTSSARRCHPSCFCMTQCTAHFRCNKDQCAAGAASQVASACDNTQHTSDVKRVSVLQESVLSSQSNGCTCYPATCNATRRLPLHNTLRTEGCKQDQTTKQMHALTLQSTAIA
jgi:hypothetical protein